VTVLFGIGILYLTLGLARAISLRAYIYEDAILGVREGRGIENMDPVRYPTPTGTAVVAVVLGFVLTILLWPLDVWPTGSDEK